MSEQLFVKSEDFDELAELKNELLEACKTTKKLLDIVAFEMNIQPFPIIAVQLNRDLIKILAKHKAIANAE